MWGPRRKSPDDDFYDAEELERLLADEHRVMIAQQVRSAGELVRLTGKRLARARRSRDREEIRSWERTDELARSMLDDHLARFPELADPELVKRLAPTRWERVARWVLRTSR